MIKKIILKFILTVIFLVFLISIISQFGFSQNIIMHSIDREFLNANDKEAFNKYLILLAIKPYFSFLFLIFIPLIFIKNMSKKYVYYLIICVWFLVSYLSNKMDLAYNNIYLYILLFLFYLLTPIVAVFLIYKDYRKKYLFKIFLFYLIIVVISGLLYFDSYSNYQEKKAQCLSKITSISECYENHHLDHKFMKKLEKEYGIDNILEYLQNRTRDR